MFYDVLICLLIDLFIDLLICLFIDLFIYLFILYMSFLHLDLENQFVH